ncbi:MAG TPA: hypothetical protein VI299_23170 [Polyangiales bacterium]
MMMSLLHTAELRRQNPVAYLTAVLRNEKAVAMNPADWLPWISRRSSGWPKSRLPAPQAREALGLLRNRSNLQGMVKRFVEPDDKGELPAQSVFTGAQHVFVARRLELDYRYHDEDPIQEADFILTFPNGFELKGKLDETGKATVLGVPASSTVRFGPDARDYKRVDDRKNPDHRAQFSDADFDKLYEKYNG